MFYNIYCYTTNVKVNFRPRPIEARARARYGHLHNWRCRSNSQRRVDWPIKHEKRRADRSPRQSICSWSSGQRPLCCVLVHLFTLLRTRSRKGRTVSCWVSYKHCWLKIIIQVGHAFRTIDWWYYHSSCWCLVWQVRLFMRKENAVLHFRNHYCHSFILLAFLGLYLA